MKKTAAIIIMLACLLARADDEFAKLDAMLGNAAKLRSEIARARADWLEEKTQKEFAIAAYEGRLQKMRKEAAAIVAANAEARATLAPILQKTARDEEYLEKLSSLLDAQYAKIISDHAAYAALDEASALDDGFYLKSIAEKFRSLAAIYGALFAADSKILEDGAKFSTGIFIKAEGKDGGEISVLNVERSGKVGK